MKTAIIALGLVLFATPAAADYVGWADTGYTQRNKRDCCEAAVNAAQDDSIKRCRLAGGFPDLRFRRSSARGSCDWEHRQMGRGGTIYRCKASAEVTCK